MFVLDNSIAMRWLLPSNKKSDQQYSETVLESLLNTDATVPNLWHLEAINVVMQAEKRGEVDAAGVENFLLQLERLPIVIDGATAHQAFSRTLGLAKAHSLSAYDAAYLELAIRLGLAIATLDKNLIKASKKAGVAIHLR